MLESRGGGGGIPFFLSSMYVRGQQGVNLFLSLPSKRVLSSWISVVQGGAHKSAVSGIPSRTQSSKFMYMSEEYLCENWWWENWKKIDLVQFLSRIRNITLSFFFIQV